VSGPLIDDRLADAIEQRRQLEIRYLGDAATGRRVVDPHVVYTGSTGVLTLDVVQVAGDSASGLTGPSWRGFDLSEVEIIRVLQTGFDVDDRMNLANSSRYVVVHLAVRA
jgi:hypothetical protein